MTIIYTLVFFVISYFLSVAFGRNFEIALIVIGTVLGFVTAKVISLQNELRSLKISLHKDWEQRQVASSDAYNGDAKTHPVGEQTPIKVKTYVEEEKPQDVQISNFEEDEKFYNIQPQNTSTDETLNKQIKNNSSPEKPPKNPILNNTNSAEESQENRTSKAIKDFFTGGNLFVRIGVTILFFGVSFLLKYVSERGLFPIEYRLIAVVIGAMSLLGLGWRLRLKNETYALLLQGAGIGILYLDIYAAFSLYQLIPPLAAFVLLFIVSMFSAALAVMQDAKSLAVLGFSGGFLAPVLASSGSHNHVGLFSYYAVLNLAIVTIAWFKAWRPLNLLGFAFTFIIGTVWGVLDYDASKFASTEPFLILFFTFYVLIAVLFALRQPPKLHGYVDGTLLFGVPLAASALQYALVQNFQYGISISSFAMGAFYLLFSSFIWKRKGDDLKLLAEAFLALAVIFASMAIPFALAPTQTAAAWALEGAGLLWLGTRQDRLSVRTFGGLLQLAAGIMFIGNYHQVTDSKAFINGDFISSMMMAVSGLLSARLLYEPFQGKRSWENSTSPLVLVWGLLWLFFGFFNQFIVHYHEHWLPTNILILTAITSLGFTLIADRLKPQWHHAWTVSSGLFLMVLVMALAQFGFQSLKSPYHPSQYNGWIAWPIVISVYYFLLHKLEHRKIFESIQPYFHSALLVLVVGLITLEGNWLLGKQLNQSSDWISIWMVIPVTIALWLIIKAKTWPFSSHKQSYRSQTGVVLAAGLSLWSLLALFAQGKSEPLPWIPLLNPLDITLLVVLMTLFKWWKTIENDFTLLNTKDTSNTIIKKKAAVIGVTSLIFLWLNFTLFRIVHHWFDVPFQFSALYHSNLAQTAVSILWALSGVVITVFAHRKQARFLWLSGALILGLVTLKLFMVDLSTLSNLARIVSFLVVGILLTSIGYFAPLPDVDKDNNENKDLSSDQQEETHHA